MPILEEPTKGPPVLATSREPVAAKTSAGKPDSVGDIALRDAVIMIVIAWLIVFLLAYSLRSYNI